MNEILLNESQNVSAAKEAPEFLEYDYDDNNHYQVENMIIEETKENLNDISVRLNANSKIHMGLRTKIV